MTGPGPRTRYVTSVTSRVLRVRRRVQGRRAVPQNTTSPSSEDTGQRLDSIETTLSGLIASDFSPQLQRCTSATFVGLVESEDTRGFLSAVTDAATDSERRKRSVPWSCEQKGVNEALARRAGAAAARRSAIEVIVGKSRSYMSTAIIARHTPEYPHRPSWYVHRPSCAVGDDAEPHSRGRRTSSSSDSSSSRARAAATRASSSSRRRKSVSGLDLPSLSSR